MFFQVFLRIQCLHSFGQLLARLPKTGVNFNSEKECFTASSTEKCFSGAESTEAGLEQPVGQRKQMMRNMAHLWLKAEVNDLESKVKGGGFPQLSPYLVPDISSFCQHLALLKQLRLSKRFVIVVPSVVIASLDERKKESMGAREAIRWLENELRHGTRYIRAQRPQECLSLSPIKYPRRKEKEAWEFFQVLECAHFFNNQGSSNDPTDPLVTLLTAGASFMPPSAAALAKSTGIQMENITDFTNKWRTSSKSQG
ncbi:nonsense-mediated mRNA decay factor SMG5-like [Tachypleus tridentatus]|uniref:nonsense-mediated mRNA decay factor SMG5-like n=1 Tax=Tachypleus tridentatus TaxID=6853 RepID=UPI003FD3C704